MTHCYNCGHAGTFVLLVEFALAVPGPVSDRAVPDAHVGDRPAGSGRRTRPRRGGDRRHRDQPRSRRGGDDPTGRTGSGRNPLPRDEFPTRSDFPSGGDFPTEGDFPIGWDLPAEGDLSLAVQCPACDSTDVGVAATDLLMRYVSSTTS